MPYVHLHMRMLRVVVCYDRLSYGMHGYDDNTLIQHLDALQTAEELMIGGTDPLRALCLTFQDTALRASLLAVIRGYGPDVGGT